MRRCSQVLCIDQLTLVVGRCEMNYPKSYVVDSLNLRLFKAVMGRARVNVLGDSRCSGALATAVSRTRSGALLVNLYTAAAKLTHCSNVGGP